ncbi:unnamed protein product [Rhizophagus irregularis]|uniref:Uncharacterized protein n=1 Tax=Rhizophagus irregularis TaxID=588596 RepID=A0A2N1MJC9_9GLOM|nr:hypothetical protein RhiirC2_791366 [Rhizophagus irregularis]CAB4392666.1 unnamed protein product [Rhizophagus irregularis]
MLKILNDLREEPVPNTNVKFIELYQSKNRISKVVSEVNIIDFKNNNVSTVSYHKGGKESIVHSCQIVLNKLSQEL